MLIDWPIEFDRWLDQVEEAGGPAAELAISLLAELEVLDGPPQRETLVLKRLRKVRRHELWRLAHAHHPEFAIRIIVWFAVDERAAIALVGFDKARLGDVWYPSAAIRAEAQVDQWLRERKAYGDESDRPPG